MANLPQVLTMSDEEWDPSVYTTFATMKEHLDALPILPKRTQGDTYNYEGNLVFNTDVMVTMVDNNGNTISDDDQVDDDNKSISSPDNDHISSNVTYNLATQSVTFDNDVFTKDTSNDASTVSSNTTNTSTSGSYSYCKSRYKQYHKQYKPP